MIGTFSCHTNHIYQEIFSSRMSFHLYKTIMCKITNVPEPEGKKLVMVNIVTIRKTLDNKQIFNTSKIYYKNKLLCESTDSTAGIMMTSSRTFESTFKNVLLPTVMVNYNIGHINLNILYVQ